MIFNFKKKPKKKEYICTFKRDYKDQIENVVATTKAHTFKEARENIRKKYGYSVRDIKVETNIYRYKK